MSKHFYPGEGYKPFSTDNYPWILSWAATKSARLCVAPFPYGRERRDYYL